MIPDNANLLVGYWVLVSDAEAPYEIGLTHLRFADGGLLQEGNETKSRIYGLSLRYWIDEDFIYTICAPNPRTEKTGFSITAEGHLELLDGDRKTTWSYSEKQVFFDSRDVWNPGILFERQTDYLGLLTAEPNEHYRRAAVYLDTSPQILMNTHAMWQCWKYGRARFASFHLEDLEFILKQGVLIDDEDNEDRTLLSYLAEDGNKDAVEIAVKYGSSIDHCDLYGWTALDYATSGKRHETAELIERLGGSHGDGWSES